MPNPFDELRNLTKSHEYFIGVDSDGCAFDTMEIKQRKCFTPKVIEHWGMEQVAEWATEACLFVNLYSRMRGCNRFVALLNDLDLVADRHQCRRRGYVAPNVDSLRRWVKEENRLGNPTLTRKVAETGDPVLQRALAWSVAVNEEVARVCTNMPPFAFVRESLEKISERADVIVVSATPIETLDREWDQHDLARYVKMICGQEMGAKKEHLQYAARGKYDRRKILMLGDAPGDLKAARANDVMFYPINPGSEVESWRRFGDEAADRFFDGAYDGDYEQKCIDEFLACLPEAPPWKQIS